MIRILREKYVNGIVLACSIIAVSISVFAEKFMDKTPCQLCLITRFLYIFISILTCMSFIFNVSFIRRILFCVIVLSMGFSFYHLGVENHWWIGPNSCVSKLPSLDDISQSVQSNVSYCDRVNLEILGLSSTLWNFVLISFLFWITSVSVTLDCYRKKNEE
ncbi:MAG: disulfide bond formation protein B [Holosporales bacterium]|jgi:disulfide bond formation protein DsbB|nr:disulfide bond formation protein B [Holosporales bacterium]